MRTLGRALLVTLLVSACGGETVGGSQSAGTSGEPATGGGASSLDDVPDAPATGTIAGRTFEVASSDLVYSTKNAQWFLTFRSYGATCGSVEKQPDPTSALLVTVGGLEPRSGDHTLALGDRHGATFQVGLYEAGTAEKPETLAVSQGTLRLDGWSERADVARAPTHMFFGATSNAPRTRSVEPSRGPLPTTTHS